MQAPQARTVHEFGDFALDAQQRTLRRRAGGERVEITERVLDALLYLVERPGQLIEKKALMAALWPHVVVEEGNLTQTIHTLRRVLGDRPEDHRYIVTVPGRGYRFVAEVSVASAERTAERPPERPAEPASEPPADPATASPPAALPSRARVAGLLAGALALVLLVGGAVLASRGQAHRPTAAVVPAEHSIAVLPFVDMSTEQDQLHFAEGLSEEILNQLAHTDNLRVMSRTSSFSFRNQNVDIATIARRLAVSHLLEGSVRKAGERIRITAQLIDGASGAHVWSETYDRDQHDILGVQREIATAVAGALHVTLARNGPKPAETANNEAYAHYLQGRYLFNRRSGDDLLNAKTHFEQALQLDPAYGRAWAALAGVYFVARYSGVDLPDAQQHWREAAERAVALAPELVEAQVRAGQYFNHNGDPQRAQVHFARAEALDPDDSMVLGFSLSQALAEGRLRDAVEVQRRMVATDPLSATQRTNLGGFLIRVGRLKEAQAELERAAELSPTGASISENLADALILQRQTDAALKVIPGISSDLLREQRFALAYFARNDLTEANAMLARLRARTQRVPVSPELAMALAEVAAFRHEPDDAFKWLNSARPPQRKNADPMVAVSMLENMQASAYLAPLHDDPRWAELVAYLGSCT